MPKAPVKSAILTKDQEAVLTNWLEYRNIKSVMEKTGFNYNKVNNTLKSVRVQREIKKHNTELREKVFYNEAVIIEKLWREATNYEGNTGQMRINALALLAKHLGMFEDKEKAKGQQVNIQVVNYAGKVEKEIKSVGEEKVKDALEHIEPNVLPDNVVIKEYSKEQK